MRKLYIVGNGGLSREIRAYLGEFGFEDYEIYVSDEYHYGEEDEKNGIFKLSSMNVEEGVVIVAIADPATKKAIVEQLPEDTEYFTFVHPTATIYSPEAIGKGTIIGPSATITTDVIIGNHCLINCNVTVGHDAIIGNYCTINPGAAISGCTVLGDSVFVGSLAGIREKTNIIANTTIGMGAVVVNHIHDSNGTYVGVPARRLPNA